MRCETIIMVFVLSKISISFIIFSSVFMSNELVNSSKIMILGLLYNALAIPTLCFSPPDKRSPSSPTFVSMPFGRLEKILSCIF